MALKNRYTIGMTVEVSYLGRGSVTKIFGKGAAPKSECKVFGFCEVLLNSGVTVSVMPNEKKIMSQNEIRDFRVTIQGIPVNF